MTVIGEAAAAIALEFAPPPKRRAPTLGQKLESLFLRGMVKCVECGETIWSEADCDWDHRHQRSTGGDDSAANLGPIHRESTRCHQRKSARDSVDRKKIRHARARHMKPKPALEALAEAIEANADGGEQSAARERRPQPRHKPKHKLQSRNTFNKSLTRKLGKGGVVPRRPRRVR